MTVEEFKAWFEGFCDGFETSGSYKTVPTEEQWKMIKDKVAELESPQSYVPVTKTTPYPIYYVTNRATTGGDVVEKSTYKDQPAVSTGN